MKRSINEKYYKNMKKYYSDKKKSTIATIEKLKCYHKLVR